jgi:hypothetical protein
MWSSENSKRSTRIGRLARPLMVADHLANPRLEIVEHLHNARGRQLRPIDCMRRPPPQRAEQRQIRSSSAR